MIIIAISSQTVRIIEALKTGRTYADIGNEFGVCKQRVWQIAKQNDLTRNKIRKSTQVEIKGVP